MKKTFLILTTLCFVLGAFAQEDEVLMTINGKPVKSSEFLYIYQKNNVESSLDPKSMDEYLDLFINFKLKVCQAEAEGIDTTAKFQQELAGYRNQATPKYLQDNEAIDSLVEMSYQRMAHPRRAGHIAVPCPITASEEEKAAALDLINKTYQRLLKGEDFFKVAQEVSSDPSLQDNGGHLGIITPFRYIYSFEHAVYTTPVGQITPIFESPYGYHIALVESEEDYEEVHAAHIMKVVPRGDSAAIDKQKIAIDSLYQVVKDGADFEQTARLNSDDRGSAIRGGDLGWFARGAMVKPFEDAAFALTEPNSISDPFMSRYGWHIIMLYDRRGIQPLDSIRDQILKQVMRDERSKYAAESFINKTRAEYNLPDTLTDEAVIEYANKHLEEKYPEFQNLVTEYHDGILLFETSLKNVWDKASRDEEGLSKYFKAHKKEYTWKEKRFKGYLVYASNGLAAKQAKVIIKSANKDSIESYIAHRINIDSVPFVRVEKGLWKKGQHSLVDRDIFKDKSAKVKEDKEMPIMLTVGKKIKNPEEYKDERGRVTSDYQDQLEKEWLEELRKTYPVEVNQEVFNRLKEAEKK